MAHSVLVAKELSKVVRRNFLWTLSNYTRGICVSKQEEDSKLVKYSFKIIKSMCSMARGNFRQKFKT